MMQSFTAHQALMLLFTAWIYISVAVLPKFIFNTTALSIVVLLVGAVLAWLVTLEASSPWDILVPTLCVIFATGLALLNAEIIFRKKNGYWQFLGRRSDICAGCEHRE
jgi:hypothetical protein